MKEKLIILSRCLITVFLLFISIRFLNIILRPVDTDDEYKSIKDFHSLPENSVDIISYGSSHMWRGLNTAEMYEKYNLSVYNYSCNWQHINTTSLFFHDSLKTQSPKIILIETFFINDLLTDTDINGEIYYTREIEKSAEKTNILKQYFGNNKERYLSYYVPLYAFHNNWTNLSKDSFQKNTCTYDFVKNRGFYSNDDIVPISLDNDVEQLPLSKQSEEILNNILDICKKNNIEVIFITLPHSSGNQYHDAIDEYSDNNQCVYLDIFDLIDEIDIDLDTDFADIGHLNTKGATKVGDYIGNYIRENYNAILENNS